MQHFNTIENGHGPQLINKKKAAFFRQPPTSIQDPSF